VRQSGEVFNDVPIGRPPGAFVMRTLVFYVLFRGHCELAALVQNAIESDQTFCHCSTNCIGFIVDTSPKFGQLAPGPKPDKEFSFDSIADGFGDLICSSQASII
jgi:hypothetical protein